jgi:DNA processing protein
MSSLRYWVWLSSVVGIRARTALLLLEHFGSAEKVFLAGGEDYRQVPELKDGDVKRLLNKKIYLAKNILNKCAQNGYRIITMQDAEYPERLRNIYDPPLVLYVLGTLPRMDEEAAVAVAGTRKCTPYGLKTAERIAYEYTKAGGLIVSGLARGIDSAAALGALRAGGRVVGVLGSGLDVVYPPENLHLFEDVVQTGAIVTEYPPGTRPEGSHFPARNRILSGMSAGILIVEAPVRSGALITAKHALEQGRDVFAVPGNVDSPASAGSNQLLRNGAAVVLSGDNLIEEYQGLYPEKFNRYPSDVNVPLDSVLMKRMIESQMTPVDSESKIQISDKEKEIDIDENRAYIDCAYNLEDLSEDEAKVLRAIRAPNTHIDEIITGSKLPASAVLAALTMLQIKGRIVQAPGKRFSLKI